MSDRPHQPAWAEVDRLQGELNARDIKVALLEGELAQFRKARANRDDHERAWDEHDAEHFCHMCPLQTKLQYAQSLANARGRIIEQIRDHLGMSDHELQMILDCKDEHHA